MKKLILIAVAVIGLALSGITTFLVTNHFHNKEMDQMTSQIATLNANLEAIGTITTCYTTQSTTFPGQQITEDIITEQSIPTSFTSEAFASLADLVGLYCKIAITPGTPITKDMVMSEKVVDSLREVDITGNRWPIGLKEGDYIDLRITYPRGEDFIVLSHKRVMSITEQTLKIHMTEEEQHLYQSALVDFYLSRSYGSDFYLTKYVEPGIQESAKVYYSVPANIAGIVRIDPNIVDLAQVSVKAAIRTAITAAREAFPEGDSAGSEIRSGRDDLNGKVNSDYAAYEVDEEKAAQRAEDGEESSLITNIAEGVG